MINLLPKGALLFTLFGLVSCGPDDKRVEISKTREPGQFAPKAELGLTLRDRVGIKEKSDRPPFVWEKPESWIPAKGSSMRVANFKFGPEQKGECYFSVLPGGGGLLPNLNRWRQQMGLENTTQEKADSLPDRKFLFGGGKFVELEGAFKSMGSAEAVAGYKMIGVIMPELLMGDSKVAFFVKMTGPAELIDGEKGNFDAFCNSLRVGRDDPK